MSDIFQQMADRWSAPVVARRQVEQFTGGALKPKHLANLDSLGTGPAERVVIGAKVCYPVQSFVDWLRARSTKQ